MDTRPQQEDGHTHVKAPLRVIATKLISYVYHCGSDSGR